MKTSIYDKYSRMFRKYDDCMLPLRKCNGLEMGNSVVFVIKWEKDHFYYGNRP